MLTFQLYGPLMAFPAPVARMQQSQSASNAMNARPGTSMVVGLLGACLGLDRGRLATLAQSTTSMAVLVALGTTVTDFQTVSLYRQEKHQEYIHTRRDEIFEHNIQHDNKNRRMFYHRLLWQDTYVIVAVSGPDLQTDERWAEALRKPVHTPYAGVKACPLAVPMAPLVTNIANPVDALRGYRMASFLKTLPTQRTEIWQRVPDCERNPPPASRRTWSMPANGERRFREETWNLMEECHAKRGY